MSLESECKLRRLLAENLSPASVSPASPLPTAELKDASEPVASDIVLRNNHFRHGDYSDMRRVAQVLLGIATIGFSC